MLTLLVCIFFPKSIEMDQSPTSKTYSATLQSNYKERMDYNEYLPKMKILQYIHRNKKG